MNFHDQRTYKRTDLNLNVRFITKEDLEANGQLIDISKGGLCMQTSAQAVEGDEIIIYPEGLGRLVGTVVRKFEDGLAVQFEMTDAQREHLDRRISSAVTGVPYLRLFENRQHKRLDLGLESVAIDEAKKEKFDCVIADLSESGARIVAKSKPMLRTKIRIGSLCGFVARHTIDGFAISFREPVISEQQVA